MADILLLSENESSSINEPISNTLVRSLSLLSLNEKWFFHDLSPDVSNRILASTALHTCFLVTNSIDTPNHFFIFVKHSNDDFRKIEIIQISQGHFQIAKTPTQTYSSLFDAVYSAKEIHFKDVPPIFDRTELTAEALEIHSILTPPSYDEVLHYQHALKDLPSISIERIYRATEAGDEDLSYPGNTRNRFPNDYPHNERHSNWFERLIEQRNEPPRKHWDLRNSGYLRIVAMLLFYFSTICIIPHILVAIIVVLILGLICLPCFVIVVVCFFTYIIATLGEEDD